MFINKMNKNNIRLVRICNANSNGVYDKHNYNFDFSQNMYNFIHLQIIKDDYKHIYY
jgi:hypothetical protein